MGNTNKQQLVKLTIDEKNNPLKDFDQFVEYVGQINYIAAINQPFLLAYLSLESLTIDVVKDQKDFLNFIVPGRLVNKSTVFVQYTLIP